MCFQLKQKYSGSCLDVYGQAKKKKAGMERYEAEGKGGFIEGSVGWNMPHVLVIAVKVAANNRERWFWGLTLCQRWPSCSLISEMMDGSPEHFMFWYSFCAPPSSPPCFSLARSWKTKPSKAEWELLGLCQSQGSSRACKSRWRDGGSWISSVWPQLNTRSPIKRDAPLINWSAPHYRQGQVIHC